MRKQTLIILTVVGLLMVWQVLAYAAKHDKGEHKKTTIEVVNLNILNGIACDPPVPGDGDQCRVRDRIALLMQHIVAAGCPDLVTLQENVTSKFVPTATGGMVGPLTDTVKLIEHRLPMLARACGFTYRVVFDRQARRPPKPGRGIDEEMMLSRYPVLSWKVMPLYSPLVPFFFRHVLYTRIDHPIGPVNVFTTHLASDSDLGSLPCGVSVPLPSPSQSPVCPSECVKFVDTVRECQAKQVAAFVEAPHDVPERPEPAVISVISGDINAEPGSNEYKEFVDEKRGRIDSHLEAGNSECDLTTGENCTTGRADDNLSDLESPDLNQTRRIDFIFVWRQEGSKCPGVIQTSDRPGVASTGLFAAEPNPFAKECGPAPLPICWPSDHSGNALNLSCEPSADAPGHHH